MKKIFIALSTIAVLLSSCGKDFVTVKHNSSEPLDEYFVNEDRMFQGLVAAYDPLNWYDYFYQYDALNMVSDIMADDIYCGGSNDGDQPVLVKTHYYTVTPTEQCDVIWTVSYSGINRSCVVIEHVDAVPGMSDETKALFKAEAMVLKSFYYNVLWKFWGNIPYYDQNLAAPYFAPQLTADEVYAKNIANLEAAIEMGVLPMKADAGKEGRVTLAMAYMLYAEMVMYQNDDTRYGTALGYMEEIINSGKYSLVSDYASIWLESGEWGTESIWEINYISEGAVRSWGSPIAVGGSVYPMLIGIPGSKEDNTGFKDGWGFSPVA
ncbi:MAG: RagB/SusD family nutrient uptake outer membrane protein, partial [Alistipes sp.]|nr:RagB/SusD family nutrient uptake outer membrane protein [Alistipes sp.]